MIYLYDGTFEGFLTCVYEHYYTGAADGIYAPGAYQPDLLIAAREVRTDAAKAGKVEAAIRDKLSRHALARVYRVFRTSVDDKEMLLLRYLCFCFKHGPASAFLRTHPAVLPVDAAELKIGNEVHRLCGLIRFSVVTGADVADAEAGPPASTGYGVAADKPCADMTPPAAAGYAVATDELRADAGSPTAAADDPRAPACRDMPAETPLVPPAAAREILYARVAPDHEVLEFIAPHFADRFKCDPFIIHDTKRGKAVIAWQKRWYIADFSERDAALLENTSGEKAYRDLWRGYFDALAIKERKNSRCQRNLMPSRYWQNLPEMQPKRNLPSPAE